MLDKTICRWRSPLDSVLTWCSRTVLRIGLLWGVGLVRIDFSGCPIVGRRKSWSQAGVGVLAIGESSAMDDDAHAEEDSWVQHIY